MTKELMSGPAFNEALSKFWSHNLTNNFKDMKSVNGFFAFSPDEAPLIKSANLHIDAIERILLKGQFAGLWFGGLHFRVTPSEDRKSLHFVFIDEKTKRSYQAHRSVNYEWDRLPLGTTYQAYAFTIPLQKVIWLS